MPTDYTARVCTIIHGCMDRGWAGYPPQYPWRLPLQWIYPRAPGEDASCIPVMSRIARQRRHKMHHFQLKPLRRVFLGFPRESHWVQEDRMRGRGGEGGNAVCVSKLETLVSDTDCAYLWWLHLQHQTSGWVDHSSKCTPSPVPHRWRVHVAIHSVPCGCNSWWKKMVKIWSFVSVGPGVGDLNHTRGGGNPDNNNKKMMSRSDWKTHQ